MSIDPLTSKVPFGVASPAYQSRSAGTDFEDILSHIQEELKTLEAHYTRNLMATDSLSPKKRYATAEEADLLSVSPLFKMDTAEFSLLDDLLMMALEDTKIAQQAAKATGEEADNPEFQVDERVRMDLSKIGGALTKLV